jgi:tetratricopeptide (TPR) repeat protein
MTLIFPPPLLGLCAFAAATLILPAAAGAQTRSDCGAKDPRRSIAGCTLVIDDPRTDAKARVRALGARGIARSNIGDLNGARADLSAVLAALPQERFILHVRGIVNFGLRLNDAALADFSAALAIDPQNVATLTARAVAYNYADDYDRAIMDASLALTLKSDDPLPFAARARAFARKDDLVHSLEDFDAAIRLNPRNAAYFRDRGHVRQRVGDLDGAIADATATIGLEPDDLIAHFDRARAYQARAQGSATEDLRKALADYDVVLRLKPDGEFLPWALSERGHVHHALGEFDAAIADFTLQLGVDSTALEANVDRAKAYAAKGDFNRAVADYDVALKEWPADAKLLAWRAEAAAKLAQSP